MNIQWLLHALAILSGIIATACGLLSSSNKIVLFICFALVAGAFELTIPFVKTTQFAHQKPPHLVLNPAKLEKVPYLQYKKEKDKIKLIAQINIKNKGKTTATKIIYSNASIKATILKKDYKVEMSAPLGNPISLAPDEDYFYSQIIEIVNPTVEQIEKIIKEFEKEDFFVIFGVTVSYIDSNTLKNYTVSAQYKITKKVAFIIEYAES